METLLTIVEVAEYLQITTRHLQNLRKMPCFPEPVTLGKSTFRFRQTDIIDFVNNGGCQDEI